MLSFGGSASSVLPLRVGLTNQFQCTNLSQHSYNHSPHRKDTHLWDHRSQFQANKLLHTSDSLDDWFVGNLFVLIEQRFAVVGNVTNTLIIWPFKLKHKQNTNCGDKYYKQTKELQTMCLFLRLSMLFAF